MTEKITICGLPWELILRDRNSRTDTNLGRCDDKDLKIFLDADMPPAQKEATFIHEWVHAVLGTYGIEHHESIAAVLGMELYRAGFRPWRAHDSNEG